MLYLFVIDMLGSINITSNIAYNTNFQRFVYIYKIDKC